MHRPLEIFLLICLALALGLLFGAAAGVVAVACLIARAASQTSTAVLASPDQVTELELRATGTPEQGHHDGRTAAPDTRRPGHPGLQPGAQKKPRCALCEAARAVLASMRKKPALK